VEVTDVALRSIICVGVWVAVDVSVFETTSVAEGEAVAVSKAGKVAVSVTAGGRAVNVCATAVLN
jgi:hypothetical protein